MYCLTSENLTHLGGMMGSERTSTNFTKFFIDPEKAKKFAEKDFKKSIEWSKRDKGFTSGDLMYVMYTIKPVKVEDASERDVFGDMRKMGLSSDQCMEVSDYVEEHFVVK